MGGTRTLRSGLAAVLALGLLAACTEGSTGDKAGGDSITLRVGAVENPGVPYAPHVKEFARQVEELSEGTLRVEIVWDAAIEFSGEYDARADQEVAAVVQSGELDMALIPSRVWDELGVTSVQALQAPFLVTDDRLVGEIVQSDLATEMLAGLDEAGVVGLALLPESLRHPVGFRQPLRTLEDFAGTTIAYRSKASYRLIESLGASPVNLAGEEYFEAVATGDVAGTDSGFIWVESLPEPGTFTANLTFFPKVNSLVANEDAYGALSEQQRATLRQAAAITLAHVLDTNLTEAESAQAYCEAGGAIVLAAEEDVAALEQAAQPVYATLEADAQTAGFIEQIRTMKAEVVGEGAPPIATCEPSAGTAASGSDGTAREFPEGVYRKEVSYSGGPVTPETDQLTFRDGHWNDVFPEDPESRCEGTYTVDGDRVTLTLTPACGGAPEGLFFAARWKLEGDQLRFIDVCCGPDPQNLNDKVWGGDPWTKID